VALKKFRDYDYQLHNNAYLYNTNSGTSATDIGLHTHIQAGAHTCTHQIGSVIRSFINKSMTVDSLETWKRYQSLESLGMPNA